MLGDIGDAHVGVLPDGAGGGLCLAGQDLDHGGLAGSVGAQNSHAAVQCAEQADVLKCVLLGGWVPEELQHNTLSSSPVLDVITFTTRANKDPDALCKTLLKSQV